MRSQGGVGELLETHFPARFPVDDISPDLRDRDAISLFTIDEPERFQQRPRHYLRRKGWTARAVHGDLAATHWEEVIAYGTITKYLREVRTDPAEASPPSEATPPHVGKSDEAFPRALEEPHSVQFDSSHTPYLSQLPRPTGDS